MDRVYLGPYFKMFITFNSYFLGQAECYSRFLHVLRFEDCLCDEKEVTSLVEKLLELLIYFGPLMPLASFLFSLYVAFLAFHPSPS